MGKGFCDGHGEERNDVRSCGRDAAGGPDAPDLCFLCRKEAERHRFWDRRLGRYVRSGYGYNQVQWLVKESMEGCSARVTKKRIRECVDYYGSHMELKHRRAMVDDLWAVFCR